MAKNLEQRVAELEKQMKEIAGNKLSKIKKKFGIEDTFDIAGVTWKILDITDSGYFCLAERLSDEMQFDSESSDWKPSSLRKHLNGDFCDELCKEIGVENIIPMKRDLLSLDGQKEYGTCEDKISMLTVDEYRKYRELIPNDDDWWWLITPWSTPCNGYKQSLSIVSSSGGIGNRVCDDSHGVRPVCIFSSSIFES